jgi:hypothetical protein
VKKYHRKRSGSGVPPSLSMKIVLKKSGNYALGNFSMLSLRALNEYHSTSHLVRRWRLSKDEKRLYLE